MDEKLKALLEQKLGLSKEAQTLLDTPEMTPEIVEQVKGLNNQIAGISSQITMYQEAKELSGQVAGIQQEMLRPVSSLPFPGGDPGGHAVSGMEGAPATFLGFRQAGFADFEQTKRETYLQQFGPGIFEQKRWDAISATDYKDAFWGMVRKQGFHSVGNVEQKLLQEGADPDGGFLVPTDWQGRIISRKPTPTRIANFVQTFNTSRDSITLPRVVYSADDIKVGVAA